MLALNSVDTQVVLTEQVRAAFQSTGYAVLPGDGVGMLAATINVYRTGVRGTPSGVSWHSHLIESPTTIQGNVACNI